MRILKNRIFISPAPSHLITTLSLSSVLLFRYPLTDSLLYKQAPYRVRPLYALSSLQLSTSTTSTISQPQTTTPQPNHSNMSPNAFAFAAPVSTFSSRFFTTKPTTSLTRPIPVVSHAPRVNTASIRMIASVNILDTMTMDQFWEHADETKVNTQYESDAKIAFLKEASFDEIKKVCIQYRYFVERYPTFLGLLVARLPDGELRSLMAEILAEELGSGKMQAAHIVWYDNFLRSLGITDTEIKTALYSENSQILTEIEAFCHSKPYEYVVGMVGMGGECLCQIYLTAMHKYLSENKSMIELGKQIDWTFWTYHIGEEDIKHREMVRAAISNATVDGESVRELFMGYSVGKSKWDRFWANNYKETSVNL